MWSLFVYSDCYKKHFTFFVTKYKNEWKKHKCWRQKNQKMSFKISNKQLLKKYNQIWKKVKSLLNIKFDSEPVFSDNDKYIKPKIKTYGGSSIINFQSKKMPKEKTPCKSWSIIMLDSVVKA